MMIATYPYITLFNHIILTPAPARKGFSRQITGAPTRSLGMSIILIPMAFQTGLPLILRDYLSRQFPVPVPALPSSMFLLFPLLLSP
jgi:hypothetical protein